MHRIVVIGGGASGLFAAIEAARTLRGQQLEATVSVIEALPRSAKKLLATGNGRCNIANRHMSLDNFHGDKCLIDSVFEHFPMTQLEAYYKSLGLLLRDDGSDRLYPMSFSAESVLDVLQRELQRLGVELICDCKAVELSFSQQGALINGSIRADRVILACGGKAAPKHGSTGSGFELLRPLGIMPTALTPALTSLIPDKKYPYSLKGVRAECRVELLCEGRTVATEAGELQFNEKSISGIPIMQLSGTAAELLQLGKIIQLRIDKAPSLTPSELCGFIEESLEGGALPAAKLLVGLLPQKLYHEDLRLCSVKPDELISIKDKNLIKKLAYGIKNTVFNIIATGDFNSAQVTRGGIGSDSVFADTLQSKKYAKLFICGEMLNVDGRCGGYNLMWANSSGRLAGKAAAISLIKETDSCAKDKRN